MLPLDFIVAEANLDAAFNSGVRASADAGELRARLAQQLELSAQDLAELLWSGGHPVFNNRLGWARLTWRRLELSPR